MKYTLAAYTIQYRDGSFVQSHYEDEDGNRALPIGIYSTEERARGSLEWRKDAEVVKGTITLTLEG